MDAADLMTSLLFRGNYSRGGCRRRDFTAEPPPLALESHSMYIRGFIWHSGPSISLRLSTPETETARCCFGCHKASTRTRTDGRFARRYFLSSCGWLACGKRCVWRKAAQTCCSSAPQLLFSQDPCVFQVDWRRKKHVSLTFSFKEIFPGRPYYNQGRQVLLWASFFLWYFDQSWAACWCRGSKHDPVILHFLRFFGFRTRLTTKCKVVGLKGHKKKEMPL